MTTRRATDLPLRTDFMMRPLTIAAGLWLAPMLLASAQQPAAPKTATAPVAASTAAKPAAASTAAAPAAASTAPAAAAAPAAPAKPAEPTAMSLKGDPAKGHTLTYTCQGCHGITGYKNAYPSYHVPRIGGQSAQYLASALTEYREGKRKHPTMQAQAQSFSPQDIADIAAYLSTVQPAK
jgi:cytochrome c553